MEAVILEHEAMSLPEGDRAVLIERLIESLTASGDDRSEAWLKESVDRFDAYKNGKIDSVDGAGVVAGLREKIAAA